MTNAQAAGPFRTDAKGRPQPTFRQLLSNPIALLAFGFGSGLAPKAPGTAGTLAALPIFYFLADLPLYTYIGVILITFVIGIYLCEQASKWLGVHDHGGIVWDEFVGMWITMIAAPAGWPWLIAGFVLFRFFDMLKPWPISLADKHIHGGFGIMVDDVFAGLAALGCLQALAYWLA
ncbi:phosphatidylglycerophosphatase A [Marinagarivorans cellulosilyticus]|uniref:Phosphatidylglycerophosphatase A n=1 Tax=Marinagarivorans cellulosilyticus TaxID=2721545 RepID=A0AAN1WEB6_9GAMM|nr:phosphatidylglycerophosphatase A [Marinagarivorans cellulosilyticus]BCD96013.1 phosphatidylglycerophosphatase A [Marinagarivorans cellulosilyticus]